MCSHYQTPKQKEEYRRHFGVAPPLDLGKRDVWPGYSGVFIRRHPHADAGDDAVPPAEAINGLFGLVPHWSTDTKISKRTYNARSETVAEKPSFRDAFKRHQRCIIPVEAFYEPDWRSGKAVATRIESRNGEPLGIAGLWASWQAPAGEVVHSYTMLTINADSHALMRHFHKPTDEKRMVVILPPERYTDWLHSRIDTMNFMHAYPAGGLQTVVAAPPAQGSLLT